MAAQTHPQLAQLADSLAGVEHAPSVELAGAAVAALLREGAGSGLELLLIRRAEREGDLWSGHVALPGGRVDASDESLIHTAARETREEVSIDVDQPGFELLGALDPVRPRTPRSPQIGVHPFVWSAPADTEPRPNHEVALARWIPLDRLRSTDHHVEHRLLSPDGSEHRFPAISLGEDILWGITHRIVLNLLAALA